MKIIACAFNYITYGRDDQEKKKKQEERIWIKSEQFLIWG